MPGFQDRTGCPNFLTSGMREAIIEVFNLHGGAKGLFEWSKKNDANRKVFYLICSKLIPKEIKTENVNETQENFINWIQGEEERLRLERDQPSKMIDAPVESVEKFNNIT